METKDKILILIAAGWIVSAVYFKIVSDKLINKMDQVEKLQLKHVEEVNKKFREELQKLNLEFIGRGKHLKKAQNDIISNTNLVYQKADSLSDNIAVVQSQLDEYIRLADNRVKKIESEAESLTEELRKYKRLKDKENADIDQRLITAQKDIENLIKQPQKPK